MYRVITTHDASKGVNYYYSYKETSDESYGNMSCETLPAFQDINKARACYYSVNQWIYDDNKYAEIIAKIEADKQAAQEEADRIARIPNNETLNEMVVAIMCGMTEIQNFIDSTVEPLAQLAELVRKE